jgi:hypothetical protein
MIGMGVTSGKAVNLEGWEERKDGANEALKGVN